MATGRVLLAILLLFGGFAPTLPRRQQRPRMNCCPDGETMQCCRNQDGCSLETCDGSQPLPLPISVAAFALPPAPRLISLDACSLVPDLRGAVASRPVLDRPDPPPRA